jgi:hypothetical protein
MYRQKQCCLICPNIPCQFKSMEGELDSISGPRGNTPAISRAMRRETDERNSQSAQGSISAAATRQSNLILMYDCKLLVHDVREMIS